MSPEWVTAIGTLGTFVVIAASATAALIQLRHMRGSNQIVALTEFRETMESQTFQEAQRFVSFELPRRLKDPVELVKATTLPFSDEYAVIPVVANMFEALGGFVRDRVIESDVACKLVAFVVLRNWTALAPLMIYMREELQAPALWENFEYLAVLSQRWIDQNPHGTYPKGEARMPEDRSLIDALKHAPSAHPSTEP